MIYNINFFSLGYIFSPNFKFIEQNEKNQGTSLLLVKQIKIFFLTF